MQAIQNETDADGWTTVRRRKRVGDDEIITAMQIKEMKRREAMQKKDFYKWVLNGRLNAGSKDAKIAAIS